MQLDERPGIGLDIDQPQVRLADHRLGVKRVGPRGLRHQHQAQLIGGVEQVIGLKAEVQPRAVVRPSRLLSHHAVDALPIGSEPGQEAVAQQHRAYAVEVEVPPLDHELAKAKALGLAVHQPLGVGG